MPQHSLVVHHYDLDHIPNPSPGGSVSFHRYHSIRNAIVRVCRRHGPTGPLGELPLDKPDLDLIADWEYGDDDPTYFVLDDQLNDEMYLYINFIDPNGCKPQWLDDVTITLAEFDGWGIGVNGLEDGYLLIFSDRLLVTGGLFHSCTNSTCVIDAIRHTVA